MSSPELQTTLTAFCAQIAADLTARLIEAAGKRVARQFEPTPRQAALRAALTEALAGALEPLDRVPDLSDHYRKLFEQFIERETVIEELTLIIDPRPNTHPDLGCLRAEFVAAGFDPGNLPGTNFNDLILTFIGAFYNAALKQEALREPIRIRLLGQMAEEMGALRLLNERTANATERTALATETSADILRLIHQALQSTEPGKKLDTYQTVAAGLRRGGRSIIIEPNGDIRIEEKPEPEAAPTMDFAPVRELVEELRRGLLRPSTPPSPEELTARRALYCRLITNMYSGLRFEGLSTSVRPIILPLEQVYVHLRAVAETPEAADEFSPEERRLLRLLEEKEGVREEEVREAQLHLDDLRRQRWTKDRLERFPIAEALKDTERRGLVILGDPGSGKSTLLHFVALVFARGPDAAHKHLALTGPDAERLPIIAPLAAYDEMLNHDRELTVGQFLERYYDARQNVPGLGPVFEAALNAGRALVLLDGLDEVVEEGRRKFVAERVSAFIREALQNGNRALLTSRIYGYRAAPLSVSLPHVTVLDFRREEIELFAQQWSRAMAAWDAEGQLTAQDELRAQDEERRLLEQIRSNTGVERLAVNPLLLTMLALLHRQVGSLPQRRIKLYDLYFDALIQNWEENRNRGARLDRPQRIDTLEAENILTPLALWLQQNRGSGTATRLDLMNQIIRFYLRDEGLNPDATDLPLPALRTAERRAEKFLDDMRQFSGLLVERGQNAFGFRHLTFQEYFAGRELARLDADARWALLKPNLHANRWREPILLAAARLGVTLNRGDQASALVEQILDAGSEHEAILHRDLFLAADCAADDIGVELPLLRRMVEGLAPLAVSRIPTLAIGATHRLSKLAQLRAGEKSRVPEALEALCPALQKATYRTDKAILEAIYPVWLESDQLRDGVTKLITQSLSPYTTIETFTNFLRASDELRQMVATKLDDANDLTGDRRVAAIYTLANLLPEQPDLRAAIVAKLDDANDPSGKVRGVAIQVLTPLLGTHSDLRAAVIAKLDDANDPLGEVCAAAIQALAPLLGEHADLYAVVATKLNDTNINVCSVTIRALAPLLGEHTDLRTAVVAKLNDASELVCSTAIWALAPLLGEHADLRAAIIAKLDIANLMVIESIIGSLSRFMHQDRQVTATISALLDHRDWKTRRYIVNALSKNIRHQIISPELIRQKLADDHCLEASAGIATSIRALSGLLGEHADLRDIVIAKLDDTEQQIHFAAIETLAPFLGEYPDMRATIATRLNDGNDSSGQVRAAAIRALAPFLSEHADLRTVVATKLNDTNDSWGEIHKAALQALSPLLSEHTDLQVAITSKLDDAHTRVRVAAIQLLAPLLGEHADMRTAIVAKLDDVEWQVRYTALKALAPLLSEHADLQLAIAAKLNDTDQNVCGAAIGALAPLFSERVDLRDAIIAKLDDPDVRFAAIYALAPLLSEHADLRAAVTAKLDDTNDPWGQLRAAAIQALSPFLGEHAHLRTAVTAKLDDTNDPWGETHGAAIRALAPLLSEHTDLQVAIISKLDDAHTKVRCTAIQVLAPLLSKRADLCAAIVAKLNEANDPMGEVRTAAIQALAPFLVEHADLRAAVTGKLDDPSTKDTAIIALAPLISEDLELRQRLMPVLGRAEKQTFGYISHEEAGPRGALIKSFGQLAAKDSSTRVEMIELLSSPDWHIRRSAAEILAEAGKECVLEALPELLKSLEDYRGLDSWPARITAAELLLNDYKYSAEAIETILPALDYGMHPLVPLPNAAEIRKQAALALGKLKAEYRQPHVFDRLVRLLDEEKDPQVLDGAFNALLSLAAAPEGE